MSVLDEYLVDPSVSFLARTRIQAQVLVPVLRALRAEIGKENADALVRRALRAWSKELFRAIGDGIAGSSRRKWATVQSLYNDVTVPGIESKVHRRDKEALEFDVTRCPYAEFFRALGEPELGTFLVCETDFDIAATGKGEGQPRAYSDDHAGRAELHVPLQVRPALKRKRILQAVWVRYWPLATYCCAARSRI